jgi:hypothetical protein
MRLRQAREAQQSGQADERDLESAARRIPYAAHTPQLTPHARSTLRVLICAWVLLFAAGTLPAGALADGDPASDVLATQALFLPWDANVPNSRQAELADVLAAAQNHGFPIRVALIASPSDLGSLTTLWGQPEQYAEFLGQELSLVFTGPLLVVMPHGFGLHGFDMPPTTIESTLAGISAPRDGAQLAQVAITAIERLAAAAGHPLPSLSTTSSVARGSSDEGSIGAGQWIVLLLGCAAIVAAWSASLRARPLRRRHEITP